MMAIKTINVLRKFVITSMRSKSNLMINPSASKEHLNKQLQLIDQILYHFMDGISNVKLTQRKLQYVCLKIENVADELSSISTDKDMTYTWLWIGETINDWIDEALLLEEFESVINLKKILENNN